MTVYVLRTVIFQRTCGPEQIGMSYFVGEYVASALQLYKMHNPLHCQSVGNNNKTHLTALRTTRTTDHPTDVNKSTQRAQTSDKANFVRIRSPNTDPNDVQNLTRTSLFKLTFVVHEHPISLSRDMSQIVEKLYLAILKNP